MMCMSCLSLLSSWDDDEWPTSMSSSSSSSLELEQREELELWLEAVNSAAGLVMQSSDSTWRTMVAAFSILMLA